MSWNSLAEVYSQRVLRRPLNEATVNIKFGDTGEDHTFELEDIYARKVLGFTAYTSEFLGELLNDWVKSGGWGEVAIKRSSEQIYSILLEVFDMNSREVISAVASDIRTIIAHKENNRIFYDFITSDKNNIFEVFNVPGVELLGDSKFLSKLCQIDFSENKVAIGPGEVAITLFTEAKNPKKGDLHVSGLGEIELKGYKGRIGDGKRESGIYSRIINKSTDASVIIQSQNKLFAEMQEIKAIFPDYKALLKFDSINEGRKIFKIIKSVYEARDLKEFFKLTNSSDFTKAEGEKMLLVISQLASRELGESADAFKEAIKNIINISYKIYAYKQGGEITQFRMFFGSDVVGDDKKLETILEYIEPRNMTDAIKDLILDKFGIIPPEQLVCGITIANYQQEEKFAYIIFANTQPSVIESGSLPCKIIGPFGSKYEENLSIVLDNINDIIVSPSADRGGFQVHYKGTVAAAAAPAMAAQAPTDSESEAETLNIPI